MQPKTNSMRSTMRSARNVMLLATVMLASGCGATGQSSGCRIFAPIWPTDHDLEVMSGELAEAIRRHDAAGQAVCGW